MVQLGDHPGVVLTERPAPVSQDAQNWELLVVDDRSQAGHPGAHERDGVRVGGVGLAGCTCSLPASARAPLSRERLKRGLLNPCPRARARASALPRDAPVAPQPGTETAGQRRFGYRLHILLRVWSPHAQGSLGAGLACSTEAAGAGAVRAHAASRRSFRPLRRDTVIMRAGGVPGTELSVGNVCFQ